MALPALIADRILAANIPGLKTVGTAADLAALKASGMSFPAVFVLPAALAGGDNRLMTGFAAQRREARVQVVMAVRAVRGAHREKGVMEIDALVTLVDDALFGWQPAAEYDPLMLAAGQLLDLAEGVVWWQNDYVTAYDRRTA